MRGEQGLLADLGSLAIPFAAHEHAAVFTVAESGALHAEIPGAHTKNLLFKDNAGAFWLVTMNTPPLWTYISRPLGSTMPSRPPIALNVAS